MRRIEEVKPASGSEPPAAEPSWMGWRRAGKFNVNLALSTVVVLLMVVFSDLIVLPILTSNAASRTDASYFPQGFMEHSQAAASSLSQQQDGQHVVLRGATAPQEAPLIYVDDSTTCHYGGIRTNQGCICGRGTSGRYCETLTVPEEELRNVTVCGTECWSAYVWYPTVHFQFRPIGDDEQRLWDQARVVMAWKKGGELRSIAGHAHQPDSTAVARTLAIGWGGRGGASSSSSSSSSWLDPVVLNWMVSLGPWTAADRQMLEALRRFRPEIPRLRQRYEERLQDASSLAPRDKARICFGLIVHKDPWQFEAIWNVMYRPQHHYIIHIDSQSDPAIRAAITEVISATPRAEDAVEGWSVWDRVEIIPLEQSVPAFWGDVTLVYLEVLMWMRAFLRTDWEWDYFINMSIADIPLVPLDVIEAFLGQGTPRNYMSWHPNIGEFRQVHFVPERTRLKEVTVLSPLQAELPSGRWRLKHGQTRLYGCTQWHMWHWTLVWEFATNPLVHGLLFSLKDTGIPDECFFATAAVWLSETATARGSPVQLPLQSGDYKYRNEGLNRNLDAPGELENLQRQSQARINLWARKAYTAHITCRHTNALLGLGFDCSKYEGKVPPEESQR